MQPVLLQGKLNRPIGLIAAEAQSPPCLRVGIFVILLSIVQSSIAYFDLQLTLKISNLTLQHNQVT